MAAGSLLTHPPTAAGQSLYTSSSTQNHTLGEYMVTSDGRGFRYVKAGELLVRGNLLQSPVVDTANDSLTPSACAAGATQVTITCGATTSVANAYANGGFISVCVAPDLGGLYPIKSHPAITSGGAITFTLYADHPIVTAWTSATRVDLIPGPYNGVIQAPTTLTGIPVGVAAYEIASGEYGWVQTHGPASMLRSDTGIIGSLIGGKPGTAGAGAAFTGVYPIIGHTMKVGVNAETVPIFLTLD